MNYSIKWFEETAWAAAIAALTYIVTVAGTGMPTDNWKPWVISLAAGVGRVVIAAVASRLPNSARPTS